MVGEHETKRFFMGQDGNNFSGDKVRTFFAPPCSFHLYFNIKTSYDLFLNLFETQVIIFPHKHVCCSNKLTGN